MAGSHNPDAAVPRAIAVVEAAAERAAAMEIAVVELLPVVVAVVVAAEGAAASDPDPPTVHPEQDDGRLECRAGSITHFEGESPPLSGVISGPNDDRIVRKDREIAGTTTRALRQLDPLKPLAGRIVGNQDKMAVFRL